MEAREVAFGTISRSDNRASTISCYGKGKKESWKRSVVPIPFVYFIRYFVNRLRKNLCIQFNINIIDTVKIHYVFIILRVSV